MDFFDFANPREIYNGNLPHWRQQNVPYFVTFRLADSIPSEKLREWEFERQNWFRAHHEPYTDIELQEFHFLFSERAQIWLDTGHGSCVLRNPQAAGIVDDSLRHYDGVRYDLDEYVVMPNHVHVIVIPKVAGPDRSRFPPERVAPATLGMESSGTGSVPPVPERVAPATLAKTQGYVLEQILHTWKSYSAHEINKLLGHSGQLWQHESYDHLVRSEKQLQALRKYIRENPCTK